MFPQLIDLLTVEALVGVVSAALHHQMHHRPQQNMPSLGGQISGMAGTSVKPTTGLWGWDRVRHPVDLPKGYHALPRGQAWQARPVVRWHVAPGQCVVGLRQIETGCPPVPARKIVR